MNWDGLPATGYETTNALLWQRLSTNLQYTSVAAVTISLGAALSPTLVLRVVRWHGPTAGSADLRIFGLQRSGVGLLSSAAFYTLDGLDDGPQVQQLHSLYYSVQRRTGSWACRTTCLLLPAPASSCRGRSGGTAGVVAVPLALMSRPFKELCNSMCWLQQAPGRMEPSASLAHAAGTYLQFFVGVMQVFAAS